MNVGGVIRKFQRVVVDPRIISIHLTKDSGAEKPLVE
jgi:hypothetical protein